MNLIPLILGFLLSFLIVPSAGLSSRNEALIGSDRIIFYHLKDTVHGGTVEIINHVFARAEAENCSAILIELDTPGGLLDSTEEIVKKFLNSEIPVIVYVAPRGARAGSAGTFITLSAHVAAMAPGTYIGAAHPVMIFGGEGDGENQKLMKKKIESAAMSFIEAIAGERGRNIEWAKKAVIESESLTADRALEKRVVDLVSPDRKTLLDEIDGRTVKVAGEQKILRTKNAVVVPFQPGFKLLFLNIIASPTIIYILILATIAGAYLEVSHPGTIFPGTVAGVCLVLLLIATRTLPVNALGVFLVLASLALMVAEIYVTSYGLLTVAAMISFFAGSFLLFDPLKTDIRIPLSHILGATAAIGTIAVLISYVVLRGIGRPVTTGRENLLKMAGIVEEAIFPGKAGKIFLNGEYWNASSDEAIQKGEAVVVVKTAGLNLTVRRK